MRNRNPTLACALVGAAILLSAAAGFARAAATVEPAPADAPLIQVTGRLIRTWTGDAGLRVILVIDGFTVLTGTEQLTARDGCIWFDEEAARKTGKPTLGIYAETAVEYKHADGKVETFDSAYLVMTTQGKVVLHPDPVAAKAESTELFLRARKLRKEYLESGRRETPTGVTPAPEPEKPVEVPGVREAGVPQEITIVAQDDVRQVNFTSFVEDGIRVSVWTGGVYVTRGDMEMAADNLVIWTPEESLRRAAAGEPAPAPEPAPPAEPKQGDAERLPDPDAAKPPPKRLAAEAYFEGHVRVNQGRRTIQCSQFYYDFQRDKALAVNTRIRTFNKIRNVPVYFYAKEVRQLAQGIFVGTDAWMTTCEFAHPHYEMGASDLTLTDLTPPPGEDEQKPEYRRIRFVGEDVQARVRSLPLAWWPKMAGDLEESATALRSIRIESRSNRGTGVVTQWHLMKLLGLEKPPEGFNLYLDADLWSERGPGIGIEGDYRRDDFYGELLSYYLHDSGKDSVGSEDVEPGGPNRGRVLWRHRHYLPQNWEMTLELSKITDANFLNEFYEREDESEKAQETLLYLKKQEQEQALTILTSARLNDWDTQTEYFPQVGYNMIGRSLLDDHLTYFQDSEVSIARYRPTEQLPIRGSHPELVADTIHELDLPLKLGTVNVVPFVEGRLSYFGDVLDRSGADTRYGARAGARAATQASRVYDDVESDLWDVHRLRHVNIFDVTASVAHVNTPSRDLIPFDVTEAGTPVVQGVDGTGVVELGWRQRFQTKRGPPERRQSVDWLTLDLENTFYSDRETPNIAPDGKRAFNHLDFMTDWRVTDSVRAWTDTNFNYDHGTLDLFAVGASVTHTPRLSYTVGHRYLPQADSARAFVGFDYRINEKWQVAFFEQFEIDGGQNAQSDFVLTRRLHRWLMRLRIELDPGEDDSFVGIELQPVGTPEIRLGG